jgi:aquaporin Z
MNIMRQKKTEARKEAEEFLDPSREWRRIFAEMWGTFLLVLVACGAVVVSKLSSEISLAMKVTAPGIMVMTAIYFMGAVSGAHLNPAVTIAFALRAHFPWKKVPVYIVSQFAGAILAAFLLKALFGGTGDIGATVPGLNITSVQALVIEIILTTGLINTILGTASGARNIGHNAAIAIGGYIVLAGLWAAPLTGASMNPARSLAPDIVRGNFETSWIYICATLIGAVIAVGFEWILKGKPSRHATLEAQGLSEDKDAS